MRRRRMLAEINVVPYIDVMLVLLVIFMVTAPMLMQGVEVELPKADAAPVEDQDAEPLIVSINSKGQLFLNLGANENRCLSSRRCVNVLLPYCVARRINLSSFGVIRRLPTAMWWS